MMGDNIEINYEDLEATDVISVEIVPERKGIILKHCEYFVSSRRHGTTVTRRFNEFVQLYDILFAKYPYRSICRLPPKRVVVGGGSFQFLERRRASLQRWLTLAARHPVLAHDADVRYFLCEPVLRLEKPKHDEFELAGTQDDQDEESQIEEMEASFVKDQEQLRLLHLGLGRLSEIFDKVEGRCELEQTEFRELGAAFQALSSRDVLDTSTQAAMLKSSFADAAIVAAQAGVDYALGCDAAEASEVRALALDALSGARDLCARLTRGLHAERAAAAARAPPRHALRRRHAYVLTAAAQEAQVWRAYAVAALRRASGSAAACATHHRHAHAAWTRLHHALHRT